MFRVFYEFIEGLYMWVLFPAAVLLLAGLIAYAAYLAGGGDVVFMGKWNG